MFTANGEWELVSMPGKRSSIIYSCCPYPYVDITYTIYIRRRVLFYLNNLIIPCIILAALTILAFYLPPESGERVSLVITVLLGKSQFNTVLIKYNRSKRDDPYRTSMKNSLELIELSKINKVSLV